MRSTCFTFSTFAQNIFKELVCNFTWNFGKVMCIKSLKMVFVARIIRHKVCMIYAFFDFFVQKLTAEINLINQSPLYTCLVIIHKNYFEVFIGKFWSKIRKQWKNRFICGDWKGKVFEVLSYQCIYTTFMSVVSKFEGKGVETHVLMTIVF